MRNERALGWFKRGVQFDVRCNALNAVGKPVKPAITVFAMENSRSEAVRLAIAELSKYGYTGITADKVIGYK